MTAEETLLARRYRVYFWLGALLALSWLSLALMDPDPPGRDVLPVGYFLGSLFAHATLAAAWVAFGPGQFDSRLALSIAWAISLPVAVGINVGLNGGPNDAVVVIGGCLLGQWLGLQIPFWTLAMGFGLHLRHSDDDEGGNGARLHFGIRHLLIIMLVVGVGLGIGRIIVSNVNVSGSGEIVIFIFLAAAAIVMTLPLLLSALMRRLAGPGVLLALLFIGVVTASEIPLLRALGFAGPGPQIGHFIAINIASAALILASALVVRLNGYFLDARPRMT